MRKIISKMLRFFVKIGSSFALKFLITIIKSLKNKTDSIYIAQGSWRNQGQVQHFMWFTRKEFENPSWKSKLRPLQNIQMILCWPKDQVESVTPPDGHSLNMGIYWNRISESLLDLLCAKNLTFPMMYEQSSILAVGLHYFLLITRQEMRKKKSFIIINHLNINTR